MLMKLQQLHIILCYQMEGVVYDLLWVIKWIGNLGLDNAIFELNAHLAVRDFKEPLSVFFRLVLSLEIVFLNSMNCV